MSPQDSNNDPRVIFESSQTPWSWRQLNRRILGIVGSYALFCLTVVLLFSVLGFSLRAVNRLDNHSIKDLIIDEARSSQTIWTTGVKDRDWTHRLQQTEILTRTVTIEASPARIMATLELTIAAGLDGWRGDDVATAIIGGDVGRDLARFTKAAFGRVSVGNQSLITTDNELPIEWSIDAGRHMLNMRVQVPTAVTDDSVLVVLERPEPVLTIPGTYRFALTQQGFHLARFHPVPYEATSSRVTLADDELDGVVYVSAVLELLGGGSTGTSGSQNAGQGEGTQAFLRRLGQVDTFPLISSLLYSLVSVLPLLIYWLHVKRDPPNAVPFAVSLGAIVATLLLFHFSLVLLNGLANAVSDLGTPSRNMAVLLGLSSLSRAISYSTPVILGLLIPTIFLQRSQYHLSKDRRRVITVVGILLLVGCLVVPTALVVRQSDLQGSPAWLALLAMIALLTILVGLSFVRLYRSMSSARPPSAIALFAAAVTLLVGLLLAYLEVTPYSYSSSPGTFVPIGWLFLSICLGAYLLFGFFNLSVAAVQAASSHWRPPAWLSKWIVILILGLVLPTTLLISGTERIAYGTTLISLGFRLNTLIVFFWLSGVAWILCQAGRSSLEVDEFTRWIGILAVSAVFYSTRSTWLYIPVTFLIGWFALTRLVRPASYWNMLSSIYENVFVKRSELLDQILDLNDAKSGYRALRKKEKEKLASDEVTIERYRAKLKVRREQLTKLEQQARIEEWPIKDVALKFGPYDTARKNSLHGARMSFLFALPQYLVIS